MKILEYMFCSYMIMIVRTFVIDKGKNRRLKACLKEGTAVNGGLEFCIPITLLCNLQLNTVVLEILALYLI